MKKSVLSVVCACIVLLQLSAFAQAGSMFWSDTITDTIAVADLNGLDADVLLTASSAGLSQADEIAVDPLNRHIYWTDRAKDWIRRANLDGSDVLTLVDQSDGLQQPHGIDLDVVGGKMYWTDFGTRQIQRANLDGTGIETLVSTPGGTPEALVLDTLNGRMYWADGSRNEINSANLDGTAFQVLVSRADTTFNMDQPHGIAIDPIGQHVYWCERRGRRIARANLDGSNPELVLQLNRVLLGLDIDVESGKVYWTDWIGNQPNARIRRANLDGSAVEDLINWLRQPQSVALVTEKQILLDVRPGSDKNPINLNSKGLLPVAVISEQSFDATSIEDSSILLGDPNLPGAVRPYRIRAEDVDGDGLIDLALKFSIPELQDELAMDEQSLELQLVGHTQYGRIVVGVDGVEIVPPRGRGNR